jgi:hypothetical protein
MKWAFRSIYDALRERYNAAPRDDHHLRESLTRLNDPRVNLNPKPNDVPANEPIHDEGECPSGCGRLGFLWHYA